MTPDRFCPGCGSRRCPLQGRHPLTQGPLGRRIAAREPEPERRWVPVWMRRDNARVLDHGAGR